MLILPDLAYGKAHCRAQFLKMFANFVHGNAALLCRVLAQSKSRLDLFVKNSLQPVRQRFAQFQAEAHVICSLVGQSDVTITFFACHFPAKPGRRLELSARCTIREFHFRHYQTGMPSAININLDQSISPWNFVAQLAQPPPRSRRPERSELFGAESDF